MSQKGFYQKGQERGQNIIIESVTNIFSEKGNLAQSHLFIKNQATGEVLDLEQLLPEGFRFTPGALLKSEKETDPEGKEINKRPVPVSLSAYEGLGQSKEGKGRFWMSGGIHEVGYGNLMEKGGLLSLLHEISHAWQDVYYKELGVEFKEIYRKTSILLGAIGIAQQKIELGEEEPELEMKAIERLKKKLEEIGVEVEPSEQQEPLPQGRLKIKTALSESKIVKSEKFERALANYEKDERDAWAHALRVLRFLKTKGFDLAPELETAQEVKEVIEPCLQTYQQHVEEIVELPNRKVRFASNPKSKESAPEIS